MSVTIISNYFYSIIFLSYNLFLFLLWLCPQVVSLSFSIRSLILFVIWWQCFNNRIKLLSLPSHTIRLLLNYHMMKEVMQTTKLLNPFIQTLPQSATITKLIDLKNANSIVDMHFLQYIDYTIPSLITSLTSFSICIIISNYYRYIWLLLYQSSSNYTLPC